MLARWTAPHFSLRRALSTLPPLPPPDNWRTVFNLVNCAHRVTVKNPQTARSLVKAFLSPSAQQPTDKKIVIEAFPGPGAITRALLALPPSELQQLIVMEDVPEYLEHLTVLEKHDSRLKVIPLSGWTWSTYSQIEVQGLLGDVLTVPWEHGVHPNLHFISHIPHSVHGDQLLAQLFRCIPERSWLFKFGRVPLSMIMADNLWQRSSANEHHKQRCKLSVSAAAVAEQRLALSVKDLSPYSDHFHPLPAERRAARTAGQPFIAANIIPMARPAIDRGSLDQWDFLLRRLFVLKSTQLKKALPSLAPGAATLLKALSDPNLPPDQRVDPTKKIRHMTTQDWSMLVKAFDEWPFAPEDLSITDSFSRNIERD